MERQADVAALDYTPISLVLAHALTNIQWLDGLPAEAGAYFYVLRRAAGAGAGGEAGAEAYLCTIADRVADLGAGRVGYVPARPDSLRREFSLARALPVEGALFGPLDRDTANLFYGFAFALAAVRNAAYERAQPDLRARALAAGHGALAQTILREHTAALNRAFPGPG